MQYHAHIYFRGSEQEEAQALHERAKAEPASLFVVWNLFARPVGPHARPMIELHFEEHVLREVIAWLKDHRKSFSVLIHQDTGNDFRDHTEGFEWLGEPLPIDFSFFERILKNPGRKIHASHTHRN